MHLVFDGGHLIAAEKPHNHLFNKAGIDCHDLARRTAQRHARLTLSECQSVFLTLATSEAVIAAPVENSFLKTPRLQFPKRPAIYNAPQDSSSATARSTARLVWRGD